ncbi:SDR family NAD(P)-dependent oxidoreductase [Hoeflea olei]|uniref:Gluconate 5-dehydrogenase n=1 Tax=Hoeflea olei TaxID=1480615 RepID=A0A1C1YXQ0_9HYPH|nr:SDR family oxidoreductase [Hoeflea olei]OCW58333.1 gluconate 5-dehydrogenase [Hoeflea olei]
MGVQDMFGLEGRVALVTGASSGLGRAAASCLAGAGAKVVGLARRADALEDWRREAQGETAAIAADLAGGADVAAIAEKAAVPFGPPDILVNAAGLNLRQHAGAVTPEGWERTIALNLTVPFFLAQALVPAMRERGWGRIINFASLQSRRAFSNGIAYGASKGGVEQLTRAMAEAWSADGINANALAPGFFPTELTGPVFADPQVSGAHAAATCIGRNGEMADLDGPLLFLASNASGYVTGQVLFVDGGYTAK